MLYNILPAGVPLILPREADQSLSPQNFALLKSKPIPTKVPSLQVLAARVPVGKIE